MLSWLGLAFKTIFKLILELYYQQSKKSYLRYCCSACCSCLGCVVTLVLLLVWLFYYRIFLFTGRINTLPTFNHDLDFSHVQWGDISPFLKFPQYQQKIENANQMVLPGPPTSMKYVFDMNKKKHNLLKNQILSSYDDFYLQQSEITVLSNLNNEPDETIFSYYTPNSPKKPTKDEEISPNRMINSQQYLFISTTQHKRVAQKEKQKQQDKTKQKTKKKRTKEQIEEEKDTFKSNLIQQVLMELRFMRKQESHQSSHSPNPALINAGINNLNNCPNSNVFDFEHEAPNFFNVHLVLKDKDSKVLFWTSRKVVLDRIMHNSSSRSHNIFTSLFNLCAEGFTVSIEILMEIIRFVIGFFDFTSTTSSSSSSFNENSSQFSTEFVEFLHKNDTFQIKKFNDLFQNTKSVLVLVDDPSVLIVNSKLHFFSDFGGLSKFFYVHTITSFVFLLFISMCCCGCLWSLSCCLCVFCDSERETSRKHHKKHHKHGDEENESESDESSGYSSSEGINSDDDTSSDMNQKKPEKQDEKIERKEGKKEEPEKKPNLDEKKDSKIESPKEDEKEEKKKMTKNMPVEVKEKEKKNEKDKKSEKNKEKEGSESDIELGISDSD